MSDIEDTIEKLRSCDGKHPYVLVLVDVDDGGECEVISNVTAGLTAEILEDAAEAARDRADDLAAGPEGDT